VDVGLARATARNNRGQDRFEREEATFHRKIREGYLELCRRHRQRFVLIDATADRNAVEEEIFEHLRPFLPEKG
jgi:dTMP kinase